MQVTVFKPFFTQLSLDVHGGTIELSFRLEDDDLSFVGIIRRPLGFAYRQADHRAVLARRSDWFDPMEPSLALWEVPEGHIPSVTEALDKLAELGRDGPSASVFTFRWWRENR